MKKLLNSLKKVKTMSKPTTPEHPKIPARILETPSNENNYSYKVEDETGATHYLSGLGSPKEKEVGLEGYVQYTSYGAGAWHSWLDK